MSGSLARCLTMVSKLLSMVYFLPLPGLEDDNRVTPGVEALEASFWPSFVETRDDELATAVALGCGFAATRRRFQWPPELGTGSFMDTAALRLWQLPLPIGVDDALACLLA